jgi:4-oxalocrotonate tautomerase
MPHVNIKHHPVLLDQQQIAGFANELADMIARTFGCDFGAESVAFEPVAPQNWDEEAYDLEIFGRSQLLAKWPDYAGPTTVQSENPGSSL